MMSGGETGHDRFQRLAALMAGGGTRAALRSHRARRGLPRYFGVYKADRNSTCTTRDLVPEVPAAPEIDICTRNIYCHAMTTKEKGKRRCYKKIV